MSLASSILLCLLVCLPLGALVGASSLWVIAATAVGALFGGLALVLGRRPLALLGVVGAAALIHGSLAWETAWVDGQEGAICGSVWSAHCGGAAPGRDRCEMRLRDGRFGDLAIPGLAAVYGRHWARSDGGIPGTGARICVDAEVRLSQSYRNPGSVALLARRSRPYFTTSDAPQVEALDALAAGALVRGLDRLAASGDGIGAHLYRAILLGDRTAMPPAITASFQDSGTAHLLAISGLHMALVGWGFFRLILWLVVMGVPRVAQGGRPRAVAGLLAFALIVLIGQTILLSDASTRALGAIALGCGAALLARRLDPWRTLALVAAACLVADPTAAFRPGFQLSFSAVAGLIATAPRRRPKGRLAALGTLVWMNAVPFVVTAPLAIAWFGQLAPEAIAINLICVPLMALVVLPVGAIWALITVLAPELGPVADPVVAAIGHGFVDLITALAGLAGSPWVPAFGVGLAALLAAGTLLTLWTLMARGRTTNLGRDRPRLALSAALVTASLWLGACLSVGPSATALRVTFLDVGHGDAAVVQLPSGEALLVDTGGSFLPARNGFIAERILLPSLTHLGVTRLTALVLTHQDADHMGAAHALMERMAIGALWVSPCALEHPRVRDLGRRIVEAGGELVILGNSTRPELTSAGGVDLEILWPDFEAVDFTGRCVMDRNDASLVMTLGYGDRRILLTGDIEGAAESSLLARGADLRADVVKVAHHGSKTSSSPGFIRAVSPGVAIVSGRKGRRASRPPHDFILQRWRDAGARVRLTHRRGAITATVNSDGSVRIATW